MALASEVVSMATWSATLAASSLPLETFKRHGVESIAVALVPAGDGVLRAKNSKLLKEHLKLVSQHYMGISEIRQYGRAGLLCRSKNLDCVADLLRCTSFASVPLNAFIPTHLACVKVIVREVDPSQSPDEVLDEFKMAGVIEWRMDGRRGENGWRLSTASVIMTFPGLEYPSEDPSESSDVLTLLKSLNGKIDKNHAEVLLQLNEVKKIQLNLQKDITDINERLLAVEEKMAASEGCLTPDISGSVAEAVRCETDSITRRLDEFEDRSRRENLIFYGLPDSQTESWVESENKIREVLSILETPLSEGAIERAHRLGKLTITRLDQS
ncbi:hypothetical protein HPB48_017123 [Haemaphysalis longicornis]|uniref:Uncharacterized protein n=1 Tax=Haemaphysalis longicornis TaxID=44386 RepID=A0A9J6GK59_HAELO|nr:hypothetical protein HPB48_017123 [Haemaphysalis longicornis]